MDKIFARGLSFKKPSEKSPSFVKGKLSIKVDEFKEFMDKNQTNGWVNVDLKEGKSGNYYAELDTWTPQNAQATPQEQESQNDQNIPF